MIKFISDTTNRLDKFLATQVAVSRARVQKAIKDGKVTVDGIIILDPDYDVIVGSVVELPEFPSNELKRSNIELKVVYENNDLAVIDKPAGMVVHPGAGNTEDTLANALLTRFPGVEKVGEPHRPGIVHRLDEDTSGLIIIAKTVAGFEYLKKQFLEHKIEKEYLALVEGVLDKTHDVINAALEKVPLKQRMKVGTGKEAVTEYWVLSSPKLRSDYAKASSDRLDEYTLLRVKLHTGRTHQIRAHLSYIGHPIIGDEVYGNRPDYAKASSGRQFLHAHRLKFQLLDGSWIELFSPLPKDLQTTLDTLGIKYDHKF